MVLGFSERVKLLLQKRLDTTKWPVGDSPPGGIRYLSDGQGNLITILTTSINPNDAEPIGPGSQEKASEVDPDFLVGGLAKIPYTITKKVNPVFKALSIFIGSTNNVGTLESPFGTDYSVPASKELIIYRYFFQASAASINWGLAYGDDGVAAGTTDPTTPIWILGGDNLPSLVNETANKQYHEDIYASVPAGKFPFAEVSATSANKFVHILGVEVDA